MAPHSSTLAWKVPWTEEPGRLQSTGSQRVGHDWSDLAVAAVATWTINLWWTLCKMSVSYFDVWSFVLKNMWLCLQLLSQSLSWVIVLSLTTIKLSFFFFFFSLFFLLNLIVVLLIVLHLKLKMCHYLLRPSSIHGFVSIWRAFPGQCEIVTLFFFFLDSHSWPSSFRRYIVTKLGAFFSKELHQHGIYSTGHDSL